MDLAWLTWFVPLVAGAGLTFFFGWLDSLLRYRRSVKDRAAEQAREDDERRRIEAREHAFTALKLASDIRDGVERQRDESRGSSRFGQAASFDVLPVRELRDAGILVPDEQVRTAILDALNLVTASSVLADEEGWTQTASGIQIAAMTNLRMVIGAYLRRDPLPASNLEWIISKAQTLAKAWDDMEALSMSTRIDD